MHNWLLHNRNRLTAVTGALILASLVARLGTGGGETEGRLLLVASLVGGLPILVQAVQALRVRVVSIDLLVTIAILGAFAIGEFEESAVVAFLFLFGAPGAEDPGKDALGD